SAPRGPSTIAAGDFPARLRELTAQPEPASDDLRTRAIRHRLTRRLLDDPVVYYEELREPELAYLATQRGALTRRISERTGLVTEVRAEGIAMVDPRDELTDVRMPEVGTDGHVALLITEHLATRAHYDGRGCPLEELHAYVRRLAHEHRAYWRRSTREPGAEVALVEHALERLAALRLIRRVDDTVHPLPALARFGLAVPTLPVEAEAGR
ncbi:MAG: TIGR02678 family protein, partial [Solirubrobacteraceae bacterium]